MLLLLQEFQVNISQKHDPPCSLFLGTLEVLCSRRLPFCSPAQPGSSAVTVQFTPATLMPSAQSEGTEGSHVGQPAHSRLSKVRPQLRLPSWLPPRPILPQCLVSPAVLRTLLAPGISLIVSRFWVAAPFFFHITLGKVQKTLWSLIYFHNLPRNKPLPCYRSKNLLLTQKESSQLVFPPQETGPMLILPWLLTCCVAFVSSSNDNIYLTGMLCSSTNAKNCSSARLKDQHHIHCKARELKAL